MLYEIPGSVGPLGSLISVIIPVWRQGLKLIAILTKNMRASRNARTPARLDDNAEESTPTVETQASQITLYSRDLIASAYSKTK